MTLTYGFNSPRDLFDKLERDAKLLDKNISGDLFFNFVVTAYSLLDWVKNDTSTPVAAAIAAPNLYANCWIKICGDIANASKHFTLTRKIPITQRVDSNSGFGVGRYGVGAWGIGEEEIEIELTDGTKISSLHFVNEVLQVWRNFFFTYGM